MATIGQLLVSLEARSDRLERELAKARRDLGRTQREMRRIGDAAQRTEREVTSAFSRVSLSARGLNASIVTISRNMQRFAVVAAAALTGGFIARTVAATDQIGKFAERVGVSAEFLQEMQFAANRTGVALTALNTAMQRIIRRAQDAIAGNRQLQEAFARVGLSLQDLQRLSNEEIFRRAITGAAQLRGGLQALVRVADVEGAALINMGRLGAEGLEDMARQARALGIVLEADVIARAARANDVIGQTGESLQGNIRRVAVAFGDLFAQFEPLVSASLRGMAIWVRDISNSIGIASRFITSAARTVGQTFGIVQRPLMQRLQREARRHRLDIGLMEGIREQAVAAQNEESVRRTDRRLAMLRNNLRATELAMRSLQSTEEAIELPPLPSPLRDTLAPTAPGAAPAAAARRRALGFPFGFTRFDATEMQQRAEFARATMRAIQQSTGVLDASFEQLNRQIERTTVAGEIFRAGIVSAFDGIEQAIGGVIQGTQTLEQALRRLGQTLLLSLSRLALNVGLNLLVPGVGGIGAGIAGALGGGGPRIFDNGGIVSQPTMGMLAMNRRPEVVAPLDRLSEMMNVSVIVVDDRQDASRREAELLAAGSQVAMAEITKSIAEGGPGHPINRAIALQHGRSR